MPKPKLDAKLVLDDLKAGMDDAALMEKYNLSTKGLHSLLQKLVVAGALDESVIWIGAPPKEPVPHADRELSAKQVLKDIKSGMSDGELMRKYRLSAKGLQNMFEQLLEAGLIKHSDLEDGKPPTESTVEIYDENLPPVAEPVPVTGNSAAAGAAQSASATPHTASSQDEVSGQPTPATPGQQEKPVSPGQQQPQTVQAAAETDDTYPATVLITQLENGSTVKDDHSPTEKLEEPVETKEQDTTSDRTIEVPDDTLVATLELSAVEQGLDEERKAAAEAGNRQGASPTPPAQPLDETAELVWQCPACGGRQTKVFHVCPECGVQVAKFFALQRKQGQVAPVMPAGAQERPSSEESPPATSEQTERKKTLSRRLQPGKPGPEGTDEGGEAADYKDLARLAISLHVVGILQIVLVCLYAGARLFLARGQGYTVDVYVSEVVFPIFVSIGVYLVFRAAGAVIRLGIDLATAAKRNNRALRKILEVLAAMRGWGNPFP